MRYNIFNKTHLPLKTALISACIAIENRLAQKATSDEEALKKVEEAVDIYKEQTTYESLHILPCIFEFEPSVWNNYINEHDKANEVAKTLKTLVRNFRQLVKAQDKMQILRKISETLNEFTIFNFNHMDDEEAVLNEILWRYYQDPVLKQIEEKMDILPHKLEATPRTGFHIATAA